MPLKDTIRLEPLETQRTCSDRERLVGRNAGSSDRLPHASGHRRSDHARRRDETDELPGPDPCTASLRLAHDALDELVRRRRVEVDDVRRDLHTASQPQAERLHAAESAGRLAHRRGDLLGDVERPVQLDVEGKERRAYADEHRTCPWVEPRRPVGLHDVAGVDSPLELGGAATPVERRAAIVGECPVEEDRHPELVTEPPRDGSRNRLGGRDILTSKCHDRDDVGRTDPWMNAVVPLQVDRLPRRRHTCDEPVLETPIVADQREHRPVVIRVDVGVEEPRARRPEGASNGIDDVGIPPLRDIRHGLERMHLPTLEIVREPTAPAYYDRRAPEYDDWYLGVGLFADRERPGFDDELARVSEVLAGLPPARTLDVACGTGFLTRHLRGEVTGLDASERMLAIASSRVAGATFVEGDALALPFPDDSFDRVVSGHFYGHLDEAQRIAFLREARRVASELVLVDASRAHSPVDEEWSERRLNDGTVWEVFKRWFEPETLLAEVGHASGDVLHAGHWFVVVRSPR